MLSALSPICRAFREIARDPSRSPLSGVTLCVTQLYWGGSVPEGMWAPPVSKHTPLAQTRATGLRN